MNFDYHKPSSAADAVKLLGKGATALAGGQTLLPVIKQGLATPSALVDLSAIKEMRGIRADGGVLIIGAMTSHAEVAASDVVQKHIPALAQLAAGIGDPQVRHRGTCGGSLANNDPAADYPAGLLGLGGVVHTNKRKISADEFFTGLFSTALADGEIIVDVHFDIPEKAAYVKFPQPASRYALVGVLAAKTIKDVRVAITGASSDGVFRAAAMEGALKKDYSAAALDGVTLDAADMFGDLHGSPQYRAHLTSVLAKRAVA